MKDFRPPDAHLAASIYAAAAGRELSPASRNSRPGGSLIGFTALAALLGMSVHVPFPGLGPADAHTRLTFAGTVCAAGMALLWRRPMREWAVYVLAAALPLAMAGSGWSGMLNHPHEGALSALGVLYVVLGAWLGRRWVAADGQIDSSRRLLFFVLALPVFAALLHAFVASALLQRSLGIPWVDGWSRVYVADAAAMLTLLPALLSWGQPAAGAVLRQRTTWLLAALAIGCLALALVPEIHDEVVRAALTLPLCWAAVRGGVVLVAQLNAAIALAMVAMVLGGLGPYVLYGLWTLQVDLIGIAVLSLLIAVAIGERQRLAARLDQARRFESLGFLAGGIAHDFNNLLGTISACAEIAADRVPPDSPGQGELAQLTREAERGRDMTQQILLAARQGDPTRSCVDLEEVVEEVIEMVRPLCPAHVAIRCRESSSEADPWVLANRGQMIRVVQNLVRNATQAARGSVTVEIGVLEPGDRRSARFDIALGEPTSDGARGWIEVADDGPGIDPAQWAHLFDPFYSTRFAQGGTGLGLAIVAGVASGHGGFVGVTTEAGRGSVFRLEVPLFDAEEDSASLGLENKESKS